MRFAVLVRCVACRRQILLCDKCDVGYHTACLRPPLMIIPDGHWFCPPCEQVRTWSAGLCRLHCHGVRSVELVAPSGMLPIKVILHISLCTYSRLWGQTGRSVGTTRNSTESGTSRVQSQAATGAKYGGFSSSWKSHD